MTGGLFAILDDIAVLLDDIAVASKLSIKKTVGILGDDLAVNAQKSSGFASSRELPVLYAISKGSFKNKLLILPVAFFLSAYAPYTIVPILLIGGLYLCYEAAEKIYHYIEQKMGKITTDKKSKTLTEYQKIKSAILTDFVLSIEIVVLTLGSVLEYSLTTQIVATTIVAMLATAGVYGLVGIIIRMDDVGLYIVQKSEKNSYKQKFGLSLIAGLPKIIKALTIIGTVAMLLVGGGIFSHNIATIHHISQMVWIYPMLFDLVVGAVVGVLCLFAVKLGSKIFD